MAKNSKELIDIMPIKAIEHNCIVSKWGDITVAFEVDLPEIFTLSARVEGHGDNRYETGDYRDLVETWQKALTVLPVNTILHKQDWFTEETYSPHTTALSYLDRASEKHFNERPFLSHRCMLYITITHNERMDISAPMTTLAKGTIVPRSITDRTILADFFNGVDQFVSIFSTNKKLALRRLTERELVGDDTAAGIIERYMSLYLREETVPLTDILFGDEMRVGDKFIKYYTISDVDDLPEDVYHFNRVDALSSENSMIAVGFAAPIGLMLNVNHVYNQYLFKPDKYVLMPEFEKRMHRMKGLGSFGRANMVNGELIDNLLTTAAETGHYPMKCHFNIMVWSDDRAHLSQIRNETTAAIARLGIRPRENTVDAPMLFMAGIPGNAADLPKEEKFVTFAPQAICLLNHETATDTSVSEFGVKMVDRLSGRPLLVDFSDYPLKKGWISNRNKFIIGPSGSGKSFLVNHFLRSYAINNSHIVIVDVGDSYEGLCAMLGGTYLTYKKESPINFNPFYIEGRFQPDIEKIEAIKSIIVSLWKKDYEKLTRLEQTALSLAVTNYFKYLDEPGSESVRPCFDSFYEYITSNLFIDALRENRIQPRHFDHDGFVACLRPFYEGGEYDYLLNSRENLDLTYEKFVVFELDNIKDNEILFPVVTMVIMDTFLTKMRTFKDIRKIILIEEAWKAIMKQEMAEYIKYLYKTVRKHFGEAWIVTQEVDDILGNDIVKNAVINNADTKIVMDQRKYLNKFTEVKNLLSMTENEKDLALSLNRDNDPRRQYKEMFVSFGSQHSAVYGLETSREEYFAFTTEATEKVLIKRGVEANGGDYDLAIRQHIETLLPAGQVA